MLSFTDYNLLGTIDLSDEAFDSERALSVYVRETDGALFTLDASGCICCTNLYDDVTVTDLAPVEAAALAELLVREANENGAETPEGRLETEEEIRTILRGAAAARSPRGPLAIES